MQDVRLHGLLLVLVIRVPANAHHHLVHGTVVHLGPAVINTGADIGRKALDNLLRKIGCSEMKMKSFEIFTSLFGLDVVA